MTIGLLPSYSNKLSIENTEEIARIKENFIVLNLLNKNFTNNFTIRKYLEVGYILLNNQKSYEKVRICFHNVIGTPTKKSKFFILTKNLAHM